MNKDRFAKGIEATRIGPNTFEIVLRWGWGSSQSIFTGAEMRTIISHLETVLREAEEK